MRRIAGILITLLSAAAFGTLAIFGRLAYAAGLDTFTLLFLRFTIATLLMGALLAFRREPLPRGKTLLQLIGMGGIGYAGQSFCYLTAIKYASAGLVALLLYLYPAMVAVLSALFLKEKINRLKIIALLIALTGTALTVRPGSGQWQGMLLALGAAGIYSIYILVGAGVMKQVSAFQSTPVIFASSGVVYGGLVALNGAHWPVDAAGWWAVAGTVLVPTLIAVTAFLMGIQYIGPTDASMLSTLEPVVTVILAALFFSERLDALTLLGGGLILTAVILLTRDETSRQM
jgi:drug/metabolite transporter (DMT)-like permease